MNLIIDRNKYNVLIETQLLTIIEIDRRSCVYDYIMMKCERFKLHIFTNSFTVSEGSGPQTFSSKLHMFV